MWSILGPTVVLQQRCRIVNSLQAQQQSPACFQGSEMWPKRNAKHITMLGHSWHMGHVTWLFFHELGALVHLDIIHLHLHGAEQVIFHRWNINGLVDHEHDGFTSHQTIAC
jgi:hypothetical protein